MPRRLESDRLIEIYRRMKTIREFEAPARRDRTGEIPDCLYAGQEVLPSASAHLDERDYIVSTHRGPVHRQGCDVTGMMLEIYGRRTGCAKAGRVDAYRRCDARDARGERDRRRRTADRRGCSHRPPESRGRAGQCG
jgi:TPP-dependent pyruvate/acetoin dehydrogenase alpha subunit